MTWYLTIRALCVVTFIAAFASFIAAACEMDVHRRSAAARWTAFGFLFAIAGCLLIGLGWTPEHP